MKKMIVLLVIILGFILNSYPCYAQKRNAEGYYVWNGAGGNPRVKGGIPDIQAYFRYMQSEKGQNDLREMLPEKIVRYAVKATQNEKNAYGKEVSFPDGVKIRICEASFLKGFIYNHLTFADGVLDKVLQNFDDDGFVMQITGLLYLKMIELDTHRICGNTGDRYITIAKLVAPPPEVTPPSMTEIIRYYYEEKYVSLPQYQYATERQVEFKGIFGMFSQIIASMVRRPDIGGNTSISMVGGNMKQFQGQNTDVDTTTTTTVQTGVEINNAPINNNTDGR